MKKYVAKRLAISVLLIFIISVFSFMLIHILPGDPAAWRWDMRHLRQMSRPTGSSCIWISR